MPYVEADLNKDLSPRAAIDGMMLYQYAYELYVLDLTQNPPRNIGPDKEAFPRSWPDGPTIGRRSFRRCFAPAACSLPRRHATSTSAPYSGPAALAELYYTRPFFDLIVSGGYTWGTVNPRLGEGPEANASFLAMGVPRHIGVWKESGLDRARADLVLDTRHWGLVSRRSSALVAVGGEVRYGVNRWLGILGGYDLRYATFDTPGTFNPPFLQQIIFFGLSGYFTNDRIVLPLTTFSAPVEPPA